MKNRILITLLVVVSFAFIPVSKRSLGFTSVEIDIIHQDSLLNVRAIEIIDNIGLAYLSSNGDLGILFNNKNTSENVTDINIPQKIQTTIKYDTLPINFRSFAITKDKAFGLTIGSPALMFDLDVDDNKSELIYREDHPDVFYDAMDFWNDLEGIAIGDSTDGCLSIIITRDGGETWNKINCNKLPEALPKEGAFAASDTNIAIIGNKTWVATTAGRIYFSPDKGKSWEIYNTPIIKDKETEGIYSIDFYDELNGFGIGGDYTKPDANIANKIKTIDGGNTWELVSNNEGPGYRSCVQYVPNSNAKKLVAIGFKGIDVSNDAGKTWKHLSDEGFYTLRFVNSNTAYAAGNGRIAKLTFIE
ncbi:beta propeller repeat protein [Neotamlana laminarinivorans]|uniref:Oxidoreductase n=1 Tax=Neotamlana laminarinivorans TaxID=2883124 RepID=A0A9X1I1Z3_9FLAO|nr:oxidoreductase [Tamlana laminarinivorans]MCB4798737.1 oxidoreductase [Tamlana laminarinivorans]